MRNGFFSGLDQSTMNKLLGVSSGTLTARSVLYGNDGYCPIGEVYDSKGPPTSINTKNGIAMEQSAYDTHVNVTIPQYIEDCLASGKVMPGRVNSIPNALQGADKNNIFFSVWPDGGYRIYTRLCGKPLKQLSKVNTYLYVPKGTPANEAYPFYGNDVSTNGKTRKVTLKNIAPDPGATKTFRTDCHYDPTWQCSQFQLGDSNKDSAGIKITDIPPNTEYTTGVKWQHQSSCSALGYGENYYCWAGPQNMLHTFGSGTGVGTIKSTLMNKFIADYSNIKVNGWTWDAGRSTQGSFNGTEKATTTYDPYGSPTNISYALPDTTQLISSLDYQLPDPDGNNFIDPLIPQILIGYYKKDQIDVNDYIQYMLSYFFSDVTSSCPNYTDTCGNNGPYTKCPRIIQKPYNDNASTPLNIATEFVNAYVEKNPTAKSFQQYDDALIKCVQRPEYIRLPFANCLGVNGKGFPDQDQYDLMHQANPDGALECIWLPCTQPSTSPYTVLLSSEMIISQGKGCQKPKCVNFANISGHAKTDKITQICAVTENNKTTKETKTTTNDGTTSSGDASSGDGNSSDQNTIGNFIQNHKIAVIISSVTILILFILLLL